MKRCRLPLWLVLSAAVIAGGNGGSLAAQVASGSRDGTPAAPAKAGAPRVTEEAEAPLTRLSSTILPGAAASAAQLDLLRKFGPPESFVVILVKDDPADPQRYVRSESWRYYTFRSVLHFLDGELLAVEDIEPLPDLALPAAYRPDAFRPGQSVEELANRFKGLRDFKVTVPPELLPGLELFAHDQLILGFEGGELTYAESLALAPDTEVDERALEGRGNALVPPSRAMSLLLTTAVLAPEREKKFIHKLLEFFWMNKVRPALWQRITTRAPLIHVVVGLIKSAKSRKRVRQLCEQIEHEAVTFKSEFLENAEEAYAQGRINQFELARAEERADAAASKMREIADAGRRLAAEEFRQRLVNEIMGQFRQRLIQNSNFIKATDKWQETFAKAQEKLNQFREDLARIKALAEGRVDVAIASVFEVRDDVERVRKIVAELPSCKLTDSLWKDLDGLHTRLTRCGERLEELKPKLLEGLSTDEMRRELGDVLTLVQQMDQVVADAKAKGATLGPRAYESIVNLYKNDPKIKRLQKELEELQLPGEEVDFMLYSRFLEREMEKAGVSTDDSQFATVRRVLFAMLQEQGPLIRMRVHGRMGELIRKIAAGAEEGKFAKEEDDREDFVAILSEWGIPADDLVGGEVEVPDVVGLPARVAKAMLAARGLVADFDVSDVLPGEKELEYTVYAQGDAAGKLVPRSKPVRLTIYGEYAPDAGVEVPNVVGLKKKTAELILVRKGLKASAVEEGEPPTQDDASAVTAQSPAGGARVKASSAVVLTVYGEYREKDAEAIYEGGLIAGGFEGFNRLSKSGQINRRSSTPMTLKILPQRAGATVTGVTLQTSGWRIDDETGGRIATADSIKLTFVADSVAEDGTITGTFTPTMQGTSPGLGVTLMMAASTFQWRASPDVQRGEDAYVLTILPAGLENVPVEQRQAIEQALPRWYLKKRDE